MSIPRGSEVKASANNAGDLGSIPGLGRSLGEGNGNPLQYSCLENLMDGGAWWARVHGVANNQTRLSDFTFTFKLTCGETSELQDHVTSEEILFQVKVFNSGISAELWEVGF